MSLTRRLLLGRGLLGAALAPFVGAATGRSVAGRLAAGSMMSGDVFPPPAPNHPTTSGGSGPSRFTSLWWDRNRWEAEDQVLAAGYTLPVDADVAGLQSLSPMARQRIMRRRHVERRVADMTVWDRMSALFDKA